MAYKRKRVRANIKAMDGSEPANNAGKGQVEMMHRRQRAFLKAYVVCGTIGGACKAVKIHRNTYHVWMAHDAEFKELMELAKEDAADVMEEECIRRATRGVKKGIWYKGEKVGYEHLKSDVLLMFMLKGMRPEKFREMYNAPPAPPQGSLDAEARQRVITDPALRAAACELEEKICAGS